MGGTMFMRKTLALTFIIGFALAAMAVPASHAQDTTKKALRVNGAAMAKRSGADLGRGIHAG